MPARLTLAVAQSRTLATTAETLAALTHTARAAAARAIDLVLFPEAYLGGYPRTCAFGSAVGARSPEGREQFLRYFQSAVDLGDTPAGAGEEWVERRLPVGKGKEYRGDGTREVLERVARETGVFLVVGVVERAGGSLFCAVLYVCPRLGVLGKRRKVMPTGTERLIWAQGGAETLRAVVTEIKGVKLTLAAAVCWENLMPQLRWALYSQNVNLYLAPTADARETWLPLMQTVAVEGRAFVLSANQCVRQGELPGWVRGEKEEEEGRKALKAEEKQGQDQLPDGHDSINAHHAHPRTKRPSITVPEELGHELKLPCCDNTNNNNYNNSNSNSPPPPPAHSSAILDELASPSHSAPHPASPSSSSSHPRRRKSIITETPEHHQICWPEPRAAHHHSTTTSNNNNNNPKNTTTSSSAEDTTPFISRGGSTIISPFGTILAGPLWEVSTSTSSSSEDGEADPGLLAVEVDFEDCERGRLDLDVGAGGHYSRHDAFRLEVRGLDLSPPV